jgi:phosphoribosylaminoimidazole-succinocarboxamide synthase
LSKEYLRRWLVDQGFRGEGAPPRLPEEVRLEAARRYIETYERLTGRAFAPETGPPLPRLRANLGL